MNAATKALLDSRVAPVYPGRTDPLTKEAP
jgi:hypothetical protein